MAAEAGQRGHDRDQDAEHDARLDADVHGLVLGLAWRGRAGNVNGVSGIRARPEWWSAIGWLRRQWIRRQSLYLAEERKFDVMYLRQLHGMK